jgi:hypothetical protein
MTILGWQVKVLVWGTLSMDLLGLFSYSHTPNVEIQKRGKAPRLLKGDIEREWNMNPSRVFFTDINANH